MEIHNFSDQIKELTVKDDFSETSSSQVGDNDEGTLVEILEDGEEMAGEGSAGKVNSTLPGQELGNEELNLDDNYGLKESSSSSSHGSMIVQDPKETDSESLKDEKSKKTISFR